VEAQLASQDGSSKNDLASSLFGRRSEKYYCTGLTLSFTYFKIIIGNFKLKLKHLEFHSRSGALKNENQKVYIRCYDGQGRSVGKVAADKNGNTVIYNDKDVPIGTGSVRKV
jgi:hypothetical protein